MSIYSREISFSAATGVHTCVVLPCHMRAALGHMMIKQIGGDEDGFVFAVYDRKGACPSAIDLYVIGGAITSVTDNGSGKCRFTVTADDMVDLRVGDTVEVKRVEYTTGEDSYSYDPIAAYNVLDHVVTAIHSTTEFDTDQDYPGVDGEGGMWQTAPEVFPTVDPDVHLVVNDANGDPITVAGAKWTSEFQDLLYQNRDNQSTTARRMASALYLDIRPLGTGSEEKDFVISYTAQARHVTD